MAKPVFVQRYHEDMLYFTSVTKTETPGRDLTELTSKPAKNPAGVGLTNPQGFVLAGVGFGNRRN
jgi:hypothetical protein